MSLGHALTFLEDVVREQLEVKMVRSTETREKRQEINILIVQSVVSGLFQ